MELRRHSGQNPVHCCPPESQRRRAEIGRSGGGDRGRGDRGEIGGDRGEIGDSSRTSALGPGGPRFRRRAGRFAPQRSSCLLLQFRHEMVISKRISGTSRRPNLVCCVRSAGQRLSPIVRGTNFAPVPEIKCSRRVRSLGMGPRARPRVLLSLPNQSGANRGSSPRTAALAPGASGLKDTNKSGSATNAPSSRNAG